MQTALKYYAMSASMLKPSYVLIFLFGAAVMLAVSKLRAANPCKRLLVVLDNVRYPRARFVQALAQRLRIRLLFLPPYSPNLNLIERFWKFLRKKVTRNTYYATFADFRAAIQRLLANIGTYMDELTTLMTENFQLVGKAG